ncbi:hypothetical protein [Porphyromonas gulae]|uniref:hypothetical protein n=1 Tax=Porphyromonas gulae TaxID=111105 RepID=UPI000AEF059A|nr:hypothetical protein [Porphyromonas gulae]
MFIILSVFEDLSISITEKYWDLYGETISYETGDRIASLLKESDVFKGISRLLEKYSLREDEVYVDGFMDIPSDGYNERFNGVNKKGIPYIFDAFIIVTVILTRSIEGFRYP